MKNARLYVIESISFALIGFLSQGVPSYLLDPLEFSSLVQFFFLLSLFRSLLTAFVLDPLVNFYHQQKENWLLLASGGGCAFMIAMMFSYLFSINTDEMSIFVCLVLLVDFVYMAFRRYFLLSKQILSVVLYNVIVSFLYILAIISFGVSTAEGVILCVFGVNMISLVLFGMAKIKRRMPLLNEPNSGYCLGDVLEYASLAKYTIIFNVLSFLLGNFYILFYSKLNDALLLSYSKSLLLFYSPSFIFISGLGNMLISDRGLDLKSIIHPRFLLVVLAISFLPIVVFYYFGPAQYAVLMLDEYLLLSIVVPISNFFVFFASAVIFILKRENRYVDIIKLILVASVPAVMTSIAILYFSTQVVLVPFVFVGMAYFLFLVFVVFISSNKFWFIQ